MVDGNKPQRPLNTRQWKLYNFLRSADPTFTQYFSQREIYERQDISLIPEDNYIWECIRDKDGNETEMHVDFHGSVGRQISEDIQYINNSDDKVQKIILTTSAGHKLATKEEYKEYSENLRKSLVARLGRLSYMDKKMNHDGQCKIIFEETSKARPYYQTFVQADPTASE